MDPSWHTSRLAFADAAEWLVSTVRLVGDRWGQPGLGEWDVRSLVGHTSRALLTVETCLSRPADSVQVESPAGYFPAARDLAAGSDVAARGRDAGEALGADPAAAVAEIATRVVALVDARDGTEVISTIVGGMRLGDYLPTRTFELVVHTTDLARALGLPLDPPPAAASQALGLVAQLAVSHGLAGPLLLATTGREGLPEGFSVMWEAAPPAGLDHLSTPPRRR